MTELRCALIGRGLVQSLSRSSLRMQGPITPGLKSEKSLCSSAETRVRAVWVPVFAGTACWKIPYAIALPQAGRGEGSELILPDGQISELLSSPIFKNISVPALPKSLLYPQPSRPERGAYRDRHGRGAGCGGRGSVGHVRCLSLNFL